ncbi:MAG: hypothetical protein AB1523_11940 [Bacillota bacterium]
MLMEDIAFQHRKASPLDHLALSFGRRRKSWPSPIHQPANEAIQFTTKDDFPHTLNKTAPGSPPGFPFPKFPLCIRLQPGVQGSNPVV